MVIGDKPIKYGKRGFGLYCYNDDGILGKDEYTSKFEEIKADIDMQYILAHLNASRLRKTLSDSIKTVEQVFKEEGHEYQYRLCKCIRHIGFERLIPAVVKADLVGFVKSGNVYYGPDRNARELKELVDLGKKRTDIKD